jgi:hypothetical protein
MPDFLVQLGAQVICAHGGQATPTVTNPRVLLSGMPSVLVTSTYVITGCAIPLAPETSGPCVTGQWLTGTTRVLSNNQPMLCRSSNSVCVPTGTPMVVTSAQTRVLGI